MKMQLNSRKTHTAKRNGNGPMGILSMLALSATTLSGYGVMTQSKEIDTVCKTMR